MQRCFSRSACENLGLKKRAHNKCVRMVARLSHAMGRKMCEWGKWDVGRGGERCSSKAANERRGQSKSNAEEWVMGLNIRNRFERSLEALIDNQRECLERDGCLGLVKVERRGSAYLRRGGMQDAMQRFEECDTWEEPPFAKETIVINVSNWSRDVLVMIFEYDPRKT